jgi:hypothetical protein
MGISVPVRTYYAERIFARTTRAGPPPNFRLRDDEPDGRSTVEGCRGGGKNILEVRLHGSAERVEDVRIGCALCNPAMMVAADILADWARGRTAAEVLAVDAGDVDALGPLFEALGTAERPDDAREKFQYALAAVQNAVRNMRGEESVPVPEFAGPDGAPPHEEREPS